MNSKVSQAIVLFVAMAAIYAVLTIIGSSQTDPYAQLVLVGTGSAILGSGLTFFMLRMFQIAGK